MRWMEDLYVSDRIARESRTIRKKIQRGRPTADVYVLILSVNPSNQLDILDANILLQPYYRKQKELTVVGLARGREDAGMLVLRIADECYRRTGGGEIRAYLSEKIRREGAD